MEKTRESVCLVKRNGTWFSSPDAETAAGQLAAYLESRKLFGGGSDSEPERTGEVIVAGGRGIRGKSDFALLSCLAGKLGGTVGASRAAVEEGKAPSTLQMGMNGRKVKPLCYIAVAISGAFQHMVWVREASYFVAVNTDRDAPIFSRADFGIVGDYREILPALLHYLEKFPASMYKGENEDEKFKQKR